MKVLGVGNVLVVILIPLLTLDPKADTWPFTQGLLLVLTLKRFFTQ